MERGVIVGGVLISASFLLAVLLNHSAVKEGAPIPGAATQVTEQAASGNPAASPQPSIRVPDERVGGSSSSDDPRCCEPGDDSCVARKNKQAQGGEPPCDLR